MEQMMFFAMAPLIGIFGTFTGILITGLNFVEQSSNRHILKWIGLFIVAISIAMFIFGSYRNQFTPNLGLHY